MSGDREAKRVETKKRREQLLVAQGLPMDFIEVEVLCHHENGCPKKVSGARLIAMVADGRVRTEPASNQPDASPIRKLNGATMK